MEIDIDPTLKEIQGKPFSFVFGNGAEIEAEVLSYTQGEITKVKRNGEPNTLELPIGWTGDDVVDIHFLPKIANGSTAGNPDEVPESEKRKIALDCIGGFIAMARALKDNKVNIKGRTTEQMYLYMVTNKRQAAFMRARCGFRGTTGGDTVWMKKSDFVSDDNIEKMEQNYEKIKYHGSTPVVF